MVVAPLVEVVAVCAALLVIGIAVRRRQSADSVAVIEDDLLPVDTRDVLEDLERGAVADGEDSSSARLVAAVLAVLAERTADLPDRLIELDRHTAANLVRVMLVQETAGPEAAVEVVRRSAEEVSGLGYSAAEHRRSVARATAALTEAVRRANAE